LNSFKFINQWLYSQSTMAELPPTPSPPEVPRSARAELMDRRRLLLIFVVLVVELALFGVGLLTPLSNSAEQSLVNSTNSEFAGLQSAGPEQLAFSIFAHNFTIALIEMIPIVGAFLFVLSIYSTGLAAQAIVVSKGLPPAFGAIIFAFPYSLVELSAYAIAVGAGVMLLVSWRRKRLREEARVFCLEVAAVAIVLLLAATMETATNFLPLVGFALWLPTGLAIAGIIVLAARTRK